MLATKWPEMEAASFAALIDGRFNNILENEGNDE